MSLKGYIRSSQLRHKEKTTASQKDLLMPRQQGGNKSLTCRALPVCLLDQWQHPSLDSLPPSCHSMTLVSHCHSLHHMTAWSEGIQNREKQLVHQILLEHSRNSRDGWFGCHSKNFVLLNFDLDKLDEFPQGLRESNRVPSGYM